MRGLGGSRGLIQPNMVLLLLLLLLLLGERLLWFGCAGCVSVSAQ